MITLNELPTEMLEMIFRFLDSPELKAVTETSKKFNAVVSNSDRLMSKFTLRFKHPAEFKGFSTAIMTSTRNYRSLIISKSRDRCQDAHIYDGRTPAVFEKLGSTVKQLTFDWSNTQRSREMPTVIPEMVQIRRAHFFVNFNERGCNRHNQHEVIEAGSYVAAARTDEEKFLWLVRHFTIVEKLSLFNLNLESESLDCVMNFPHLKELKMEHCDENCFKFLANCTQILNLEVSHPLWVSRALGIEKFETFLISQNCLKHLTLNNFQYPRLFIDDRTASIRFKLDSLILQNVNFFDSSVANNLLKAQNKLKTIEIQIQNEKNRNLDQSLFYNYILKTIVTTSPLLHTINVTKTRYKMRSFEIFEYTSNPHVKTLIFNVSADDKSSKLFKVFIRMFPNLETICFNSAESDDTDSGVCFDKGTVLEHVTSLSITNASVRSLVNVSAPALQDFKYLPGKTGQFIDDLFGSFFHRHKTIKNLIIGTCCGRSYFFVSYNLCQLIVNFLTNLETVSIYNFNEVNKSIKLLCSLEMLKTLNLTSEDHQQITSKTKVECARNNLKVTPKPLNKS